MNTITIPIEVELTPRSKAVMDALYRTLDQKFQDASPGTPAAVSLQPGERYAGVVLDADGKTMHHLVLLPQRPDEKLDWQDAMDWATSVGGFLPTRQEQALLFANCKPHVQPRWHWSCEKHETDASYAWGCLFYTGYQTSNRKSFEGSAVAVRYIKIGGGNG